MADLHDPPLERRVVAYLLATPIALRRSDVRPSDMADAANAEIIRALRPVHERGPRITGGAVCRLLKSRGLHDAARVALDLVKSPSGLQGVDLPVAHLRDLAERRALQEPLVRLLRQVTDGDLSAVRAGLEALVQDQGTRGETPPILATHEVIRAAIEEAQRRKERGKSASFDHVDEEGRVTHLLTGLADHLMPGFMTVVGGSTGAGKSQFALVAARRYAAAHGCRAGIVSCEDMAHIYGDRTAAYERGIAGLSMLRGPQGDRERALREADGLADEAERQQGGFMRLSVVPDGHMDRVIATMRAMVRQKGCGILVVDYLSRLTSDEVKNAKIYDTVRLLVPRVKAEAMRLNVPLVLVSQLNRRDGKEFEEPFKSDLLGGSVIEQAAEAIALLWKPAEHSQNSFVKVAKLKQGTWGERATCLRNAGGMIYSFGPYKPLAKTNGRPRSAASRDRMPSVDQWEFQD